jgi:hypothetical protein
MKILTTRKYVDLCLVCVSFFFCIVPQTSCATDETIAGTGNATVVSQDRTDTQAKDSDGSVRIIANRTEQLFGAVASWKVLRIHRSNALQLAAWVQTDSGSLTGDLQLTNDVALNGDMQFGFNLQISERKTAAVIGIKISEKSVFHTIQEVTSNIPLNRFRLDWKPELDQTIRINEVVDLATIKFPTATNSPTYTLKIKLQKK